MHNPSPDRGSTNQGLTEAGSQSPDSGAPDSTAQRDGDQGRAAVGPSPAPVSAAESPLPAGLADSPAAAVGRRSLSTAFVQVGPDGHLTVELRNGRVLVLRDVVMRPKDYCGIQALGGLASKQHCGGYAEVAGARPGGAPIRQEPDLAGPNPLESRQDPGKRN
jgi:hypothetical protein